MVSQRISCGLAVFFAEFGRLFSAMFNPCRCHEIFFSDAQSVLQSARFHRVVSN